MEMDLVIKVHLRLRKGAGYPRRGRKKCQECPNPPAFDEIPNSCVQTSFPELTSCERYLPVRCSVSTFRDCDRNAPALMNHFQKIDSNGDAKLSLEEQKKVAD